MAKYEINHLIELLKEQILIYQKTAERKGVSEEDIEDQVNFYLEELQRLLKEAKETEEE